MRMMKVPNVGISQFPVFLFLLATPLLFHLGCWQWSRAQEKVVLMEQRTRQTQATPLNLPALVERLKSGVADAAAFPEGQPLSLSDFQIQPTPILWENQHQNHRLGYRVFLPLMLTSIEPKAESKAEAKAESKTEVKTESSKLPWILLDRGWIPADESMAIALQERLRDLPSDPLEVYLHWPQHGLRLSDKAHQLPIQWPLRVQWIDTQALGDVLAHPLCPWVVQEAVPVWTGMKPEKHRAYAGQWFLLSLLSLGYAGVLIRKKG